MGYLRKFTKEETKVLQENGATIIYVYFSLAKAPSLFLSST
jgi:hypothetical protein